MAPSTSDEFATRTDPLRRELLAYCYRMLGSVHDAEDLVQETLLRAWRAYDRYDPSRASLRTWLYRIATNVCLTALDQRSRRPLPSGLGAPTEDPQQPLSRGEQVPWLEPIPDAMLGDPAHMLSSRGSLRLAFVAATQLLPARQRAVLILRDVLDWPAADVAATLQTTSAAVNSALQRARARLEDTEPREDQIAEPADPGERARIERYVTAIEKADLAALTKLLTDDVILEMPPFLTWFAGRERYISFIARSFTLRGTHWRMVPLRANGQPALAAYTGGEDGGYTLHSLQVLTLTASGISRNTAFQDPGMFASFDLPARLIGAEK